MTVPDYETVIVGAGFSGQANARTFEAIRLAECCPKQLSSRASIENARGETEARVVRIGDAIGADVTRRAEELHEVEVGQRGIEERQIALISVGRPEIKQSRPERHSRARLVIAEALEPKTRIQRGIRQ